MISAQTCTHINYQLWKTMKVNPPQETLFGEISKGSACKIWAGYLISIFKNKAIETGPSYNANAMLTHYINKQVIRFIFFKAQQAEN